MKIIKRVVKAISNLLFYFLLAIIILLIAYVVTVKIYQKQNKLGEIPINFYTILTQSMYPRIKAGDIVITFKNKNDMYKEGDVITFISDSNVSKGITITHRVVTKKLVDDNYYYYTKGDSNNTQDSAPVPASNVIGKVILKLPKAGFIQQFMVSKFGWLIVVVLPCSAILIYDAVKLVEKMFKKKEKEHKLGLDETSDERDDLHKIINSQYISKPLQDKIDEVYDNMGIKKEEQIESLDSDIDKKEDDNVEVL